MTLRKAGVLEVLMLRTIHRAMKAVQMNLDLMLKTTGMTEGHQRQMLKMKLMLQVKGPRTRITMLLLVLKVTVLWVVVKPSVGVGEKENHLPGGEMWWHERDYVEKSMLAGRKRFIVQWKKVPLAIANGIVSKKWVRPKECVFVGHIQLAHLHWAKTFSGWLYQMYGCRETLIWSKG